jgi:hypothetical protein
MALAVYTSAAFSTASGLAVGASAEIEVRRESDGALASIFSDVDGTTPLANPFSADSEGRFAFYASGLDGGYRVKVTKGAETYTLRHQAIGTAAQRDFSEPVTTKGDLVVGGASGTKVRKAVGTNGRALVGDSAQADGLLWAHKAITPGGRLTLTTGVPVTSSDVTGATTVYYTLYKHDVVELYDGAGWIPYQFSELSQATTDATKSPAAVAASKNYDVFVWNDSGTLRATRGPTWDSGAVAGSDTARGTGAGSTELELFEGRYVNKNAITNGPAARRGLYVGTIRSDALSQINDSLAKRHVWNNYNRVARAMRVAEITDTWTYTTNAFRQANGSAANQFDMVRGLDEDAVSATVLAAATWSSTAFTPTVAIGLDSTTTPATGCLRSRGDTSAAGFVGNCMAFWNGLPGLGRHFLAWLENPGVATGTATWHGDSGGALYQQGMTGEVLA